MRGNGAQNCDGDTLRPDSPRGCTAHDDDGSPSEGPLRRTGGRMGERRGWPAGSEGWQRGVLACFYKRDFRPFWNELRFTEFTSLRSVGDQKFDSLDFFKTSQSQSFMR